MKTHRPRVLDEENVGAVECFEQTDTVLSDRSAFHKIPSSFFSVSTREPQKGKDGLKKFSFVSVEPAIPKKKSAPSVAQTSQMRQWKTEEKDLHSEPRGSKRKAEKEQVSLQGDKDGILLHQTKELRERERQSVQDKKSEETQGQESKRDPRMKIESLLN